MMETVITHEGNTKALKRSIDKQISKAVAELLVPFKPELDDRDDAKEITTFFRGRRLVACVPCLLASGRTLETIADLIPKGKPKKSNKLARRGA